MEYRQLGDSGLKISTPTPGTMMFGGPTDDATAERIIDAAQEQGVNSIDTADVYHQGESERGGPAYCPAARPLGTRHEVWQSRRQPAAGKLRHYGLSNHRASRIAEFSRVADLLGVPRPVRHGATHDPRAPGGER